MDYLMVGGPLDGRYLSLNENVKTVRDPNIAGAYVRSLLSDKVAVFHFKEPVSRWTKKKRLAGFPSSK